ncbi:hypothetical protein BDV26DRAFT_281199 [Aspergillus bertholletiae]|uniref:Secreted protein n=1 Tax=Aspergillus bertholletiae TaxID=1226010 RepID=A0A5N7B943_9EURO|nr:hypothetical protein BDV26DRAFT_281199 [Aspergillus bertholletiae]
MKFSSALAVMPALLSLGYTLEAPIPGYGIWEPEWSIEAHPGRTIQARGTIQEVRDELLRINPDWDEHYIKPVLERSVESTSEFSKRTDFFNDGWLKCGVWPSADVADVKSGIQYLRGVSGNPQNGPGPGNCGRVSCGYNAAIWWCNDTDDTKTLESFGSVADGAQAVLESCSKDGELHWNNKVSGQAFHDTKWNVIVRGESC